MLNMVHWGTHQLCAIDTETTGLDAHWNEILQIAILPLDSNIKPRKDVMPFVLEMKPDCPERIDPEAMRINKIDIHRIMMRGFDKEKAKDLFRDWVVKLGLPLSKNGYASKIMPLGQNFAFDRDFIRRWMGIEMYEEFFDYHYKDTMISANFINDHAAMHGNKAVYTKINLRHLATHHKVDYENHHDALSDCVATAEVYRKMLMSGLFA